MGSGSFDAKAYRSTAFYSVTTNSTNARSVFTKSSVDTRFKSQTITLRESCISEEHPYPTPFIIGLDCTGSMGFVAKELAGEGIATLIEGLHGGRITSPHILLQFIGDVKCDSEPIQITQFESDMRIVEQLKNLWLEGGGGGNSFESYNLPWYFAAFKTKLDSYDKQGRKGYIFTVGDELVPDPLNQMDILRAFGDSSQCEYSNQKLLELASEKYHVFHVISLEGSFARGNERRLRSSWEPLLGRRALFMRDHKQFANIVLAATRISEGEDREDVIASFQDKATRDELEFVFPA